MQENKENPSRIVIEPEDLDPPAPVVYPGLSGSAAPHPSPFILAKAGKMAYWGGSQLRQGMAAGLIGGLIGWGLSELLSSRIDDPANQSFGLETLREAALWMAVISAGIGGVLSAAEGATAGAWDKALKKGIIGIGIGFVGGMLGGLAGQLIYGFLGGGLGGMVTSRQVLVRTVGWALLGLFVGASQGIAGGAAKKIGNGLLGGLVGGAVGGVFFDGISLVVPNVQASRLFGIAAMGFCVGVAIGMVEEVCKEAWLRIIAGPQTGKQFVLYGSVSRIGRSPACEITLVKDPAVWPEHARIMAAGASYQLEAAGQAPVLVNGGPVVQAVLRRGDVVQIGGSAFVFDEKTARPAAGAGL